MSSIDQRVVEMRFNNKQFENGVKTSVKSLDDLKKGLDLDGATKSLAGLGASVDNIASKFSSMGVIAFSVLQRLTNSAIDAGLNMVKALTVNPINEGFADYNRKLTSVQTIMNATGKSIKEVSKYFDELDEYADKTIYNLDDMTSALAKFTNANVDLDKSVPAIKGIANMTALAGQDAAAAQIAFYNLSQSIGNGFLSTSDYRSLNLANVATFEWKENLIKAAVAAGTLKKASNGLYNIPGAKGAYTATALFNEELSKGWASAKVLVDVLGQYGDVNTEIGKKAQAAAQDIKSFGMMIETLKASVATGWTDTFEIIIGDLIESKALFTGLTNAIGSFLDSISNYRNNLLQFWKDNGGRQELIMGISNAFIALSKVIQPIEQAFVNIFPKITGDNLVYISRKFRELTEAFMIGEGISDKIRRTFQGLFANLDNLRMLLTVLVGAVIKLFKYLSPLGNLLLSISAVAGDFMVGLNKIYKTFGLFSAETMTAISELFTATFSQAIAKGVERVSNKLKEFANVLKLNKNTFEFLRDKIYKITIVLDAMASKFTEVKNNIVAFGSVFKSANKEVVAYENNAQAVTTANNQMAQSVGGFDGFVITLKSGFQRLLNFMKPVTDAIVRIFDTMKAEVSKGMENITFEQVIHTIQSFISGALFLSIRKLISVFSKNLPDLMQGATATLESVRNSLEAWQKNIKSKMILNIAIALGILTAAIYVLADIDPVKIGLALGALTVMFAQLIGGFAIFANIMNAKTFLTMGQLAMAMISISISVSILASAMNKISTIDWNGIAKGLVAVTVLLGELLVVSLILSRQAVSLTGASIGLIGLATSIGIFSLALEKVSKLGWKEMIKGLVGVSASLAGIMVLATVTSGTGFASSAIGIAILAGSLYILTGALAILGNMTFATLGQGLGVVALALTQFVLAMMFIPPNLIASSLGVLAIAGALNVMASAVAIFGNMEIETIRQGLLSVAAVLGVLVIAMNYLVGTLPAAAAVVVIAISLTMLIYPLSKLGEMPIKTLAVGILAMTAALLALGGVSYVLSPLAPALGAIAASVALLGSGMALAGLSVLAFVAALGMLATSAVTILAAIPTIGEVIRGVIDQIKKTIPVIKDTLLLLLEAFIQMMPKIKAVISKILLAIIEVVNDNVPALMNLIRTILYNIIELWASMPPKIAKEAIKMIIATADALKENEQELKDAVIYLLKAILAPFAKGFSLFKDVGKNMILGLKAGISENLSKVVESAKGLGKTALAATEKSLGIQSPSKLFKEIGQNLANALGLGMDKDADKTKKSAKEMGESLGPATADGINKNKDKASDAAKDLSEAIRKEFEKSMAWIEERKYYNQLSLQEELAAYERMHKRYQEGTEERKKLDREIYRVKMELIKAEEDARKKAFEDARSAVEEETFYDRLNLHEKLEAWKEIYRIQKEGSDEQKKAAREVYALQKEVTKYEEESFKTWLEDSNEKYQKQQDIFKAYEEYSDKAMDVVEEAGNKRLDLEEEYYNKTKEINDKLKADLKSVTDEYNRAVETRANTLYNSYGLFDKIQSKDPVNGSELITNLEDQIKEFESWQQNIQELSGKGIDTELLKELQDMGPKSIAEIKALNQLSNPELTKYVSLWRTKHQDAKTQALGELEGLRTETLQKIKDLETDAVNELEIYKQSWLTKLTELQTDTVTQLQTLKKEWMAKIGPIRTDTEKEFETMTDNLQTTIKDPNWSDIGADIIRGIKGGVSSEAASLAAEVATAARQALQSAKDALGIQSPSKEFAKVGKYSIEGFVVGLRNFSNNAITAAASVGNSALSALKNTMSNISSVLDGNMDMNPVIRPVLDLTDVEAGGKQINSIFTQRTGINLASVNAKIPNITPPNQAVTNTNQNGSNQQASSVSFVQNNYSPKSLSRLDIYRQTKNQISAMKGLVRTV